MTTPALSASLITGLKGDTAWRFSTQFGTAFEPRFFCCSCPHALGITGGKEPVAILQLEPNPVFTGDSASFDGSLSYDPDGTVTGYSWTFESGTPATYSTASDNVSWSASGTYEVKLIVTDGTGLQSTPAIVQAKVIDHSSGGGGQYYAATDTGVYYTSDSGNTWSDRSGALSGSSLIVNDVKVDPATRNYSDGNRVVWIGTASGIWASEDGDTWYTQSPSAVSNSHADSPAPSPQDLSFDALLFTTEKLFAIANWENSGGSARGWLFYTDDFDFIRSNLSSSASWGEY